MSFPRGVAVTGFCFELLDRQTGLAVMSGDVVGWIVKDGATQDLLTNTPTHKGLGQWSVDLTATEMDAAVVALLFTHDNAISRDFVVKTTAKVDGITRDQFERLLLAFIAPGRTEIVDNGDGTMTRVAYARDDATWVAKHTFNNQGEWLDVEVNGAV